MRMKKNGPDPFFLLAVLDDEVDALEAGVVDAGFAAGAGVDDVETTPRVGTSGMERAAAELTALFLIARFAVDFFALFFAVFFTAFLAGRLVALAVDFFATFLTDFLADFLAAVFLTAFLAVFLAVRFAATEMTPCNETAHVAKAPCP